ncbi:helix-turn-helix transcriptional regulator [Saccharothrix lopnurensis]|uniref:AAA family ATPase n=1 Tax=Saccharothrix lopnurensis TaxID=1670621 RepID=A0ABW1NWZ0_9PSEU
MRLVEREQVLGQLTVLIAAAVDGRGQVVLVSGPGAGGKTALVHALDEPARAAGALVFAATCSRDERGLPGGVLSQLATAMAGGAAAGLGAVAHSGADTAERARNSPHLVRDAGEALLDLARTRPVVLVVDDVEHADPLSLHTLFYLVRRVGGARIAVVLTASDHPGRGSALALAELTRMPWYTGVRLAPLSRRGVARLVSDALDPATASRCAPFYHAVTGGNPVLVKALVQDHLAARRDHPDHDVVVGEAFRQAVLACLRRWGPDLLHVVRAIAVLGENPGPEVLGRLPGVPLAAEAVTALDHAGLLDDGRFRHPAVRAAVLDDLPAAERTRLHRAAAELLFAEGLPSADIAAHLVAAGSADAPWAVSVLRDAAEGALAEQHLDRAADCLKLARTAIGGEDPTAAAGLTAALAAVQWRTSPSVVARLLPALRRAAREGHLTARDTRALLRYQLWQGDTAGAEETLRALEEAAARAVRPAGAPEMTEHRVLLDWVRAAHPTVAAAVLPGDRGAAPARDHREEVTAYAEWVLRSRWAPDSAPELAVHALLALGACGMVARARQWCDALREEVGPGQASAWKAVFADARAHLALMEGDLATAERLARLALTALAPHDWGPAIASPLAALVLSAAWQGKHDDARAHLRRSVPIAARDTASWAVYLRARGHAHLAAGRPDAAFADFDECGALAVDRDLDLPALLPWRTDLAQALVRLRRPERAGELALAQLDRPGADVPRVRGASLRLLAAATGAKPRLAVLREAVVLLQDSGDQVELALALAALSTTHDELGETGAAEVIAKRAVHVAEACGAGALCRRHLLPQLDPAPAGDGGAEPATGGDEEPDDLATLSSAERRVAVLAALGCSNREIGRRLYITISTVEQHLTRVYRKLKVRRRADLPTGLLPDSENLWMGSLPFQLGAEAGRR